ncbi:MAG: MFS transporter, partial [Actinobacteria bacterium]|nr:MFS transporter [Actinomycetota bacterium]
MTSGSGSGVTAVATGVHSPAFRRLWWAWTVSLCGDGVRTLALPLYVAMQTRDALAVSAVAAAEVLPW